MNPRERGRLAQGTPSEHAARGNARLSHCRKRVEIIVAR